MSRRRRLSRIVFGGLIKRQRTNYPNGGENNWRSTEIGNRTTVGGIHTSARPTFGLFWRTGDGRKNKQKAWICFALAAVEGWRQPRRYTRGVQCDRQPKSLIKSRMSSGRREKVWKITDIASTAEHANDRLFSFVMTDDIIRRPPNAA